MDRSCQFSYESKHHDLYHRNTLCSVDAVCLLSTVYVYEDEKQQSLNNIVRKARQIGTQHHSWLVGWLVGGTLIRALYE